MATSLTWVTPPGSIANFSIGSTAITKLVVADTNNTGATLTFSKIGGDLPPGLTLSTNGTISGTPEYVTSSNNYFISFLFILDLKCCSYIPTGIFTMYDLIIVF